MKKILFSVNHFDYSNGVAMALKNIIANIDQRKYEIYVNAIYNYDQAFGASVQERFHKVPGFGFYFRGLDKIVNLMPNSLLYKMFFRQEFDLEIAFQYGIPTKVLSTSKGPKICWMHTYDKNLSLREYYKRFDRIITVSKVGSERLVENGFDRDRVDYCYNIIDEESITQKQEEQCPFIKGKERIITTVARLDKDKAYMRYFKCINAVRNKIHNTKFWIVGGGSEETALRNYIKDNSLQDLIVMTGAQKNPYPYLKQSDLYFCSSYREGFSTACQEASIIGIPVVSVSVDGAEELVELAGCGKVIDNTEEAIMDALVNLSSSEDLIHTWKETAQNNKNRFYKRNRIQKIESVIDSVLNQ